MAGLRKSPENDNCDGDCGDVNDDCDGDCGDVNDNFDGDGEDVGDCGDLNHKSNLELLDGHLVVPVSGQLIWLGRKKVKRIILGKQTTKQIVSNVAAMCGRRVYSVKMARKIKL